MLGLGFFVLGWRSFGGARDSDNAGLLIDRVVFLSAMAKKGGGRRTMALKKMATLSTRAVGGSASRESSRSSA